MSSTTIGNLPFQETSSPVAEDTSAWDYFDVSPPQSSLATALASDTTQSAPQKKKRSHGKSRPPGHIPRPPNAFIIFRTDYIRAMETQNSTPEVSKRIGQMWKAMSDEQREPYILRAEEEKIAHKAKYPDYKFKPIHPRDQFGNCIRKPRKPNKPRVKKAVTQYGDSIGDFSCSPQWPDASDQRVNDYLPDPSPPISPPSTPPPPPISFLRRSSSVPLPMPDNPFIYGPEYGQTMYSGFSTTYNARMARRLSKRPSTSMGDYTSAGPSSYFTVQGNHEEYTMTEASAEWRSGHRRSISAPGFEFVGAQSYAHQPVFDAFAPEVSRNTLTPIHPDFHTAFSEFSWPTANAEPQQSYPLNVSIPVPSMTHSPSSSDLSSAVPSAINASPVPTQTSHITQPAPHIIRPAPHITQPAPHIIQPAPVAKFDVSTFQLQMSMLEGDANSALHVEDLGFDNVLGLSTSDMMGGWDSINSLNANTIFDRSAANQDGIIAPHSLQFGELIAQDY